MNFFWPTFKDGDSGTQMQRAAALRHNQQEGLKVLPAYIRRYGIVGVTLAILLAYSVPPQWLRVSLGIAFSCVFALWFHLVTMYRLFKHYRMKE